MTIRKTRQYRPVSTSETTAGDGVSVRSILDLADSINNYAAYIGNHKIVSEMFINTIESGDGVTAEKVILPPFAPRHVGRAYNRIRWAVRHNSLNSLTGGMTTTWRLYAHRILYKGPLTLDQSYMYLQQVSSIVTPGYQGEDDPPWRIDYEETSLKLVRDSGNLIWLILTAQNSDASMRAQITSLDVWPVE